MKHHDRRSARLQGYDYSQAGAYFITICSYNRECLFGEIKNGEMILNGFGEIVVFTWFDLVNHENHISLDYFVVMPNHVHGIIVISTNKTFVGAGSKPALIEAVSTRHGLSEIVRQFKTFSAKRINQLRETSAAAVWQRNYYEHVIRSEDELNRIREYIQNNPLQWEVDPENPAITR